MCVGILDKEEEENCKRERLFPYESLVLEKRGEDTYERYFRIFTSIFVAYFV